MNDYVLMPKTDYQNICNTLREYISDDSLITSNLIPNIVQSIYNNKSSDSGIPYFNFIQGIGEEIINLTSDDSWLYENSEKPLIGLISDENSIKVGICTWNNEKTVLNINDNTETEKVFYRSIVNETFTANFNNTGWIIFRFLRNWTSEDINPEEPIDPAEHYLTITSGTNEEEVEVGHSFTISFNTQDLISYSGNDLEKTSIFINNSQKTATITGLEKGYTTITFFLIDYPTVEVSFNVSIYENDTISIWNNNLENPESFIVNGDKYIKKDLVDYNLNLDDSITFTINCGQRSYIIPFSFVREDPYFIVNYKDAYTEELYPIFYIINTREYIGVNLDNIYRYLSNNEEAVYYGDLSPVSINLTIKRFSPEG